MGWDAHIRLAFPAVGGLDSALVLALTSPHIPEPQGAQTEKGLQPF